MPLLLASHPTAPADSLSPTPSEFGLADHALDGLSPVTEGARVRPTTSPFTMFSDPFDRASPMPGSGGHIADCVLAPAAHWLSTAPSPILQLQLTTTAADVPAGRIGARCLGDDGASCMSPLSFQLTGAGGHALGLMAGVGGV